MCFEPAQNIVIFVRVCIYSVCFYFLKAPVEDSVSGTVESKLDLKKGKALGVSPKTKVC